MTEDFWKNSQFSVARHYGGMQANFGEGSHIFEIVNKNGTTLFELSTPPATPTTRPGMARRYHRASQLTLSTWSSFPSIRSWGGSVLSMCCKNTSGHRGKPCSTFLRTKLKQRNNDNSRFGTGWL